MGWKARVESHWPWDGNGDAVDEPGSPLGALATDAQGTTQKAALRPKGAGDGARGQTHGAAPLDPWLGLCDPFGQAARYCVTLTFEQMRSLPFLISSRP